MKKTVVYGLGNFFKKYESFILDNYNVVAILDKDSKKWCGYNSIPVMSPECVGQIDYDEVLIVLEIKVMEAAQLLSKLDVDINRIKVFFKPGILGKCDIISHFILKPNLKLEVNVCGKTKFCLESITDFFIFNEIYLSGTYRMVLPWDDIIVVDIGMNVAMATLYFASMENVQKVYGFEAFPSTYKKAQSNINMNEINIVNKIVMHNYALSDYEGTGEYNYAQNESGNMSIVNDENDAGNEEEYSETVIIKDAATEINNILKNENQMKIILKCDCEGSEYPIFKRLDECGLLWKFSAIIMETHFGRENEIIDRLRKNGFSIYAPLANHYGLGMIFAVKN